MLRYSLCFKEIQQVSEWMILQDHSAAEGLSVCLQEVLRMKLGGHLLG